MLTVDRPRPGIAGRCCGSSGDGITPATVVFVALLLIFGIQFLLFTMLFDMESTRDLRSSACTMDPLDR